MSVFDRDNWYEIWASLDKNRVRTALTAFGVFWGIFMLMLLLGSGRGLENGTQADFAGSATNSFYVWTRATTQGLSGPAAWSPFRAQQRRCRSGST